MNKKRETEKKKQKNDKVQYNSLVSGCEWHGGMAAIYDSVQFVAAQTENKNFISLTDKLQRRGKVFFIPLTQKKTMWTLNNVFGIGGKKCRRAAVLPKIT